MRNRYTSYFWRGLFVLLIALFSHSGLSAQEKSYRHIVQAGETLYGLSERYGVTVDQIKARNPQLRAAGLKAGAEVLIPVIAHRDGVAGSDCRTMHEVKKKETLFGIAKKYGLTVDELLAANAGLSADGSNLKKGNFLCIPYAKGQIVETAPAPKGYERLRVAVVLPFLCKTIAAERCVEFYRGFLMAVEQLKKSGTDIHIAAYDEPQGNVGIQSVMEDVRRQAPQLVIGPLYPEHFDEMAAFANGAPGVKWLVPFSSRFAGSVGGNRTFLLNAPVDDKAAYVADLFQKTFPKNKTKVVFLHEPSGDEVAFSAALRSRLVAVGYEMGEVSAGYDVSALQQSLAQKKLTVFVPDASGKEAANALLVRLSQLRTVSAAATFALLGYPEWITTDAVAQESLFAADTYVFTNHFYNKYAADTQRFAENYQMWFKTSLLDVYPRMALLGFDAGCYMLSGLKAYGAQFGTQKLKTTRYQTDIHFSPGVEARGYYVNDCMYFLHYGPNRSVSLLSGF